LGFNNLPHSDVILSGRQAAKDLARGSATLANLDICSTPDASQAQHDALLEDDFTSRDEFGADFSDQGDGEPQTQSAGRK